jgi:hypothetical protein
MNPIFAYIIEYGSPSPDQIAIRLWILLAIMLSPIFLVYGLSKLHSEKIKLAIFRPIVVIFLLAALIVPTVGPPSIGSTAIAVLSFCTSLELLWYEWGGSRILGVIGVIVSGIGMYYMIPGALPHYLMTGRI